MSIRDEVKGQKPEIRKTIIIEALTDTVFKAITEQEELTQWFPDQAILEPRVLGKVRFTTLKQIHPEWKLDRDYIMEGTIKEFVRNRKLSYTWKYRDTPDFPETTVVWELVEIAPGKTRVELTHSGFTGEEKGLTSLESHNEGWTEMLNKLANYCKGRK
jgi:uncharacterized protein YndB with AHSA1/START domain